MSSIAPLEAPLPRASLSDLVYARLGEALTSGQFAFGEELNEISLATYFRVSRTPVREALRRLAADGLVVNSPNRQATVVRPSRQELIDAYEVRLTLESAAARRAAERIQPEQLASLQRLVSEAPPPYGREWEDPERRFDDTVHLAIAAGCGNARLQQEIGKYLKLVRFVRARVDEDTPRLEQGNAEHQRIVAALAHREPEAAERAMSEHIESCLRYVLEDLTEPY